MNQQTTPGITLFDLLARNWQRPAGIRQICFNDDETVLAIVSDDGGVAFARMADNEPPASRIVSDNGQTGIRPRSGRPSPLIVTRIKGGYSTCPAAADGFLAGNEKGQLVRLSRAGEIADTIFAGEAPVTAFDRCIATGDIAILAGDRLLLRSDTANDADIQLGGFTPTLVSLSPDGARLALAGPGRLEVRHRDGVATGPAIALPSHPISLAWSANGRWLAAGMKTGGLILADVPAGRHAQLANFPAAVGALDFGASANALVAAGAYRIAGWSLDVPPMEDAASGALATGRTGLAIVEAVAIQPQGNLVAAGYANGQVIIARLGSPDEMMLRASGDPVTALVWTRDGQHLALGDALGNVAIATFPGELFK